MGNCANKCSNSKPPVDPSKSTVRRGRERRSFHDDSVNFGTYEGDFNEAGEKHGKGVWSFPDGAIFEGEFRNDMKNGKGKYVYVDGDVYEGDWKDNMKNGVGRYTFFDGDAYEGGWKDGLYHGKGVMSFAGGDVYDGEYVDGRRSGLGVYRKANGKIIHSGQWRNGEPYGKSYPLPPSKKVEDTATADICVCFGRNGDDSSSCMDCSFNEYALLLKYLTGN